MAERISDRKFLDADPFEVKLRDKFFGGVRNIKNSRDTISSALKQKLKSGRAMNELQFKGPQTQYFLCLYFLLGSRYSINYNLPFGSYPLVLICSLSIAVEKWLEIGVLGTGLKNPQRITYCQFLASLRAWQQEKTFNIKLKYQIVIGGC